MSQLFSLGNKYSTGSQVCLNYVLRSISRVTFFNLCVKQPLARSAKRRQRKCYQRRIQERGYGGCNPPPPFSSICSL